MSGASEPDSAAPERAATERRVDPHTGRGVVLAPGRRGIAGARRGGLPEPHGRCPFCPGHESDTEPTVARWPSEGPWKIRVVHNKFPIVAAEEGTHEVGVDSREHDVDLADFDGRHACAWLRLYAARVAALEAQTAGGAVLFFRNRGRRAGSSQPHPHSQIVATPWVPHDVALRTSRKLAFHAEHGRTLHRAEIDREARGPRVLERGARVLVFCPYAPSRPYEMRVAPLDTAARFADSPRELLDAVAMQLVRCARRLRAIGVDDFNLVLRQAASVDGPTLGWHIDVLPRLGGDAGFELAGGEMIVVVTPEDAAERLRDALA